MNQNLALDWLKSSYSDIVVIESILDNSIVTHMTAFHAQQSVEKSLKAILEYHNEMVPKKHDVLMLKDLVQKYIIIENESILEDLNSLYLDSRYPGSFGLLPYGKPTLQDANEFYKFAKKTLYDVCALLSISMEEMQAQ